MSHVKLPCFLVRNAHCLMNSLSPTMCIKTFAFFDLETTGLPQLENNRTKITELSIVTVSAEHLELGCYPRVLNKLSFCLNPQRMVSIEATSLTGLSNDLLQHQNKFSSETVDAINGFLKHCQQPVCLVAHNGYHFDFPIFQYELKLANATLPSDVLCLDSLVAFRELDKSTASVKPNRSAVPFQFNDAYNQLLCDALDEMEKITAEQSSEKKLTVEEVQRRNETTPKKRVYNSNNAILPKRALFHSDCQNVSYKLTDVYTRLTSKPPINEHQAESDVRMLIHCAAVYGERFINFANFNAKKLCDISAIIPGGNCIRK